MEEMWFLSVRLPSLVGAPLARLREEWIVRFLISESTDKLWRGIVTPPFFSTRAYVYLQICKGFVTPKVKKIPLTVRL